MSSSIRGMIRQAKPEESESTLAISEADKPASARAKPQVSNRQERGGGRRPLALPPVAPPEERKPLSTRIKPSLKKALEDYNKEIRDAGFNVTQELILDALLRELRDNDDLREKIANTLISEL